MATVITAGRGSRNRLTPEQIAQRRQAAAVAELKRNGIETIAATNADADRDKRQRKQRAVGVALAADRLAKLGIEYRPQPPVPCREFVSSVNAVPMGEQDINNVARLTRYDYELIVERLRLEHPKLALELQDECDEQWGEWADDDVRWTLTPHELKKRKRQRAL